MEVLPTGPSQEQGHSHELEVKVIAGQPSSAQRPHPSRIRLFFIIGARWAFLIPVAFTQSLSCQASADFSFKVFSNTRESIKNGSQIPTLILLCPHTSCNTYAKVQCPQSLQVSGTVTTPQLLKPSVNFRKKKIKTAEWKFVSLISRLNAREWLLKECSALR